MNQRPDAILTIGEVAACLEAGKRKAHGLTANGKLLAFESGGKWCLRRSSLDKWIASRIGKAMVDDDGGAE